MVSRQRKSKQKGLSLVLFGRGGSWFCLQNKNIKMINIYLEECKYEKKIDKTKKRHIKVKIIIPDSGESNESNDESIE